MKARKAAGLGGALVLGIVLVGGGAAFADTTAHAFNDTIPALQQSHYLPSGGRSTTGSSSIEFTSIGNGQLLNVKAQNLSNNTEYTELKGLSADSKYHAIANKTPIGQNSRLIVTQYDYNVLTPNAKGNYKIN